MVTLKLNSEGITTGGLRIRVNSKSGDDHQTYGTVIESPRNGSRGR